MSVRVLAASVAVTALVLLASEIFALPLERAVFLAPVIVVAAAAAAGLVVLWTRVGLESLRASRHPRLVVAASIAFVGLVVVLSLLGVKLPRE